MCIGRVSVTVDPSAKVGLILVCFTPSLDVNVEEQQIKLLPPLDKYALKVCLHGKEQKH